MRRLKTFLEEVEKIRLKEAKRLSAPLPECETHAREVLSGISLIEKRGRLFLLICEDNRRYELKWPGAQEDYLALKNEFRLLPLKVPCIMVRVLRFLNDGEMIRERRRGMSRLKTFLEEVEDIQLEETRQATVPFSECEAYAREISTGIRLIEKDRKFFLMIYEDNRPSDERYEVEWPGTEEDFEAMKRGFKFLPFNIPYIMIRVLRLLNETELAGKG